MTALSGQKTVTTAGTAVVLGAQRIDGPLTVKALLANTNNIYIGNDGAGDVTSGNGYELDAGDVITFQYVGNLASLWLDADTNGEGVSWHALIA
jgi:hypothetical protein